MNGTATPRWQQKRSLFMRAKTTEGVYPTAVIKERLRLKNRRHARSEVIESLLVKNLSAAI
jgi:hypothetical protein